MNRRTKGMLLALLVVSVVVAPGCGKKSPSATPCTMLVDPRCGGVSGSTTSPDSTPSTAASYATATTASFTASTDQGDSIDVTVSLTKSMRLAEASVPPDVLSSCNVGYQSDRSLYVHYTVTANVTSTLAAGVQIMLNDVGLGSGAEVLYPAAGSGWVCPGNGSGGAFIFWASATPGQQLTAEGWLVEQSVLTPAHPEGDPDYLGSQLVAPIVNSLGASFGTKVTNQKGSGFVTCHNQDPANLIGVQDIPDGPVLAPFVTAPFTYTAGFSKGGKTTCSPLPVS